MVSKTPIIELLKPETKPNWRYIMSLIGVNLNPYAGCAEPIGYAEPINHPENNIMHSVSVEFNIMKMCLVDRFDLPDTIDLPEFRTLISDRFWWFCGNNRPIGVSEEVRIYVIENGILGQEITSEEALQERIKTGYAAFKPSFRLLKNV